VACGAPRRPVWPSLGGGNSARQLEAPILVESPLSVLSMARCHLCRHDLHSNRDLVRQLLRQRGAPETDNDGRTHGQNAAFIHADTRPWTQTDRRKETPKPQVAGSIPVPPAPRILNSSGSESFTPIRFHVGKLNGSKNGSNSCQIASWSSQPFILPSNAYSADK